MKSYKWVLVVVAAVVIFFLRTMISAACIDLFLMIDNSLEFSNHLSPVLMWIILGLFVGLVFGTITAWKKYRIDFKLNYIFFAALLLFLTLASFINRPATPKGTSFEPVEPLEPVSVAQKFGTVYYKIQDADGYTNLRREPNGEIIRKVYPTEKFEIIGSEKNFKKVKFGNGAIGFIHESRVVKQ